MQKIRITKTLVLLSFVFLTCISIHPLDSSTPQTQDLRPKKNQWIERAPHVSQETEEYFFSTGPNQFVRVGESILQRGGTAADAALTSALARIVQDMGNIVSFAGIFMMVYYEAATGQTHSLNACFKTVQDEQNPLTIPTRGIPNARAVLVPGFMAGVQAAHDRFGRLPWPEIFAPAVDLAESGFGLSQGQIEYIKDHWEVLGVLPETRAIFLKRPYGFFYGYEPGDTFTQPALAQTLRRVAAEGASYMYTGEWGRKFVNIIRREGGNMAMRDMEEYRPVWAEPARTSYLDYELNALGYPSLGAMNVVLAVNLMECADLASYDHNSRSAEALYRLICCSRAGEFFYPPYAPEVIKSMIPEGEFDYDHQGTKAAARLIWEKIESGEWRSIERAITRNGYGAPGHSEGIISVDREGNVAAVCHTINCDLWGNSGIFVDGVSVPGAAYFQRDYVNKVGPGEYLPDTTNPCLVLQNGRPVFASTCIGSDLHSATVQNLYNLMHFDYTWSESRATPKFQSVDWQNNLAQKVKRHQFTQGLLDAVETMGMPISLVDDWPSEYWIGWRLNQTGPRASIKAEGDRQ